MKSKFGVLFLSILFTLLVASESFASSLQFDSYGKFYVNMPESGVDTVYTIKSAMTAGTGTFKIFDNGGEWGNYSNSASGKIFLKVKSGSVNVRLFGSIKTESGWDKLSIYSGTVETEISSRTNRPISSTFTQGTTFYSAVSGEQKIDPISTTVSYSRKVAQSSSSNPSVTERVLVIEFNSDGSNVKEGLDLTVVVTATGSLEQDASNNYFVTMPRSGMKNLSITQDDINQGITSFAVYDNGGKTGNYSDSCKSYLQITVPDGYRLKFWALRDGFKVGDEVYVYDGNANASRYLVHMDYQSSGTNTVGYRLSGQTATVYFSSNESNNAEGFYLYMTLEYPVRTIEFTGSGTVTATKDYALPGTSVTATATPSSGYVLDSIVVASGPFGEFPFASLSKESIPWWSTGGKSITFTVPDDTVIARGYFSKATANSGLSVNIPASGTQSITLPTGVSSFRVYDNGGKDADYSCNLSGYLILTAPSGYVLNISGSVNTEARYDSLKIYDGSSTSSTLLKGLSGQGLDVGSVFSSSNVVMLYFKSDVSITYSGLDLLVRVSKKTTSHTITYASGSNGSITGSTTSATMGQTVTLTATPNAGYVFSGVSVTDADGNVVNVIQANGTSNTISFTMDFSNVTVKPFFATQQMGFDEEGCLTNGWYFRFKDGHLSQGALIPTGDNLEQSCWYRTVFHQTVNSASLNKTGSVRRAGDGYTTEEGVWLQLQEASSITLDTDLDFGGYSGDACVVAFKPLSPKTLTGNNKIIKNLCIESNEAGFFTAANADVSNVTFQNARIVGTSKAGVLAPTKSASGSIQSVTVTGSTIDGEIAGALIGDVSYNTSVSKIVVDGTTVTGRVAGGVVGTVNSGYSLTFAAGASYQSSISASTITAYYTSGFTVGTAYAGSVTGSGSVVFNYPMVTLSSNTVSAAASIGTAWSNVYLGGFVGQWTSSTNQEVKGATATGMSVSNASSAQNAYVGGYFGAVNGSMTIRASSYQGPVSGGTSVGGFIGKFEKTSADNYLKIFNTYSDGRVSGSGNVGYIVGEWSTGSTGGTMPGTDDVLYNNYHYGTDETAVGVGNYTLADWTLGADGVHSNVRNATGSLTASGTMGLHKYSDLCATTYHVDFFEAADYDLTAAAPTSPVRNGIATDDDMASDKFVALLNENRENSWGDSVWYRNASVNNGRPVPTSRVAFRSNSNAMFGSYVTIELDDGLVLENKQDYGFYDYSVDFCNTEGNVGSASNAMVGWTTSDGYVSSEFAEMANTVKDNLGAYIVDNSGQVVDLATAQLVPNSKLRALIPTSHYTVSYEYCVGQNDCSPFEDVTDKNFLFLSPVVTDIIGGDAENALLIPDVVTLDDVTDFLSIGNIEYRDAEGSVINFYGAASSMTMFTNIIQQASQNTNVTEIAIQYWPNGTAPTVRVHSTTGDPFSVDIYAKTMAGEIVALPEIQATVLEGPSAFADVMYGVSFDVHFEDRIGYTFDSYSALLSLTRETNCSEYNGGQSYETDNLSFASWNDFANLGECEQGYWTLSNLKADDKIGLVELKVAMAKLGDLATSIDITPTYTPNNYFVNFDLSSFTTDDIVALGHSWANVKEMSLDENHNKFPKMYWKTADDFAEVVWSGIQMSQSEFEDESMTWNEWLAAYASVELTQGIIGDAIGDDASQTDFSVFPVGTATPDEGAVTQGNISISAYDENDNQLTGESYFHGSVVLTQSAGDFRFMQNSRLVQDVEPVHMLSYPEDIDDTLEYLVSFNPDPGYAMQVTQSNCSPEDGLEDGNWCYVAGTDENPDTLRIQPSLMNQITLGVLYSAKPYDVSFDLESVRDSVLVLAGDWSFTTKTLDVMRDITIPKAYMMSGGLFHRVFWSATPNSPDTYGGDWYDWFSENASIWFTSKLVGQALGTDRDGTAFTLYPIDGYANNDETVTSEALYVIGVDENNQPLEENAYHGRLVLSQTVGDLTWKWNSYSTESCKDDISFCHAVDILKLSVQDTVIYNVSLAPDPGYTMSIESFESPENPNPDYYGYSDGVLKSDAYDMAEMAFYVRFGRLDYNIRFTNPDPAFVANKVENGVYTPAWLHSASNVNVEDFYALPENGGLQAPQLYNSTGCRIGWKVKGVANAEGKVEFRDVFADMTPKASEEDDSFNELVPDFSNPECDENDYYVLTLDVEGEGAFKLIQKLGAEPQNEGDPEQVVVEHEFVATGSGTFEMRVPKIMDWEMERELGVTLTVEAIPEPGFIVGEITYNAYLNGNNMTVLMENGASINVMQNQQWHVKFSQINPVYVTYDLGLRAVSNDSSDVWLPSDASPSAELQIGEDGSAVKLWTPFRGLLKFGGWTTVDPNGEQPDVVVRYTEVNLDNVAEFSTDAANPTKLYAKWDNLTTAELQNYNVPMVSFNHCDLDDDGNCTPVNNGMFGRSFEIVQTFGSTVFRHGLAGSMSTRLPYNPAGYDIIVRLEPGLAYAFDESEPQIRTFVSYLADTETSEMTTPAEIEPTGTKFRIGNVAEQYVLLEYENVTDTAGPYYYFTRKGHELRFAYSYDVNAGDANVFYGENWNASTPDGGVNAGIDLATNAYRADACLVGWSFDKDAVAEDADIWSDNYRVYYELESSVFSDSRSFLADYYAAVNSGKDAVVYGVWSDDVSLCVEPQPGNITVSLSDELKGKATVELVQNVNGIPTVVATVGDEGISIPAQYPREEISPGNGMTINVGENIYFTTLNVVPAPGYELDVSVTPSYKIGEADAVEVTDGIQPWNMLENTVISGGVRYIEYALTFDVNAGKADVFYPSDWSAEATYNMTMDESARQFPKAYRADKCLVGYGFTTDAFKAQSFMQLDSAFIAAYDSVVAAGMENPVLYGVWNECSQELYTVGLYEPVEGTLVLSQNGNSFNVPSTGLAVPSVTPGIEFSLSFVANNGYQFDSEGAFNEVDASGTVVGVLENNILTVDGDKIVDAPASPKPYTYAFDVNVEEGVNVFYGSDWKESDNYELSAEGTAFPRGVYRVGACLKGWAINKASTTSFLQYDADFVDAVEKAKSANLPVSTLYAMWGACETEQTLATVTNANPAAGRFMLTRTVSGTSMTYEVTDEPLVVPADEALTFEVSFVPGVGYTYDESAGISADGLVTISASMTLTAAVSADTYTFALNENAGDADVFYAGTAATEFSASITDNASARVFPANLYRTDACLVGWNFSNTATTGFTQLDSAFIAAYRLVASENPDAPTTLYAVWNASCHQVLYTVTSANAGKGTLTIAQGSRQFEVAPSGMSVPAVEGGLSFTVSFVPATGYDYVAAQGFEAYNALASLIGKLTDDILTVDQSVAVNVVSLTPSKFEIAFVENAGDATVFYGDGWRLGTDQTEFSFADSGAFPTDLYRTDACLAGWTLTPETATVTFNKFDSTFVAAINASAEYEGKLYAKWESCLYDRNVTVSQLSSDAGKMILEQTDAHGNKKNRTVIDDAAVTLPLGEGDISFEVSFNASTGYALDEDSFFYTVNSQGNDVLALLDNKLTLSGNTVLRAPVNVDTYSIVFDANAGDANVFYGSGWLSENSYAMDMPEIQRTFPTEVYRVGYTLLGWSFTPIEAGTTLPVAEGGQIEGVYSRYETAFISKAKEYAESPITLYAVWGTAENQHTYHVTLADAATGTLKVQQTVGKTSSSFTVGAEGLEVPAVSGGLMFKVSATLNDGYYANGVELYLQNADGERIGNLADGMLVVDDDRIVEIPVENDGVRFVFDVNTDARVFYEDGWTDKGYFALEGETVFPKSILRTDAKLRGWAISRVSSKIYEKYDAEFVKDLRNYQDLEIPVNTLYAVWDEYSLVDNVYVKNNSDKNGSFYLTQTVNGVQTDPIDVTASGVQIPYSANGLSFNVTFVPKAGYHVNAEEPISSTNASGNVLGRAANGGTLSFASVTSLALNASVEAERFKFNYNVNRADANVFYGAEWSSSGEKSLDDSSVVFPTNIYRSDACLEGWSVDPLAETGSALLTSELIETLDPARNVNTLYAVWRECEVETYKVSFANTNVGSLVLTQDVEDTTITFPVADEGLEVPVIPGGLTFRAAYTLKAGYSGSTDSLYVIDDISGILKTLADNSLTVDEDITLAIPTNGVQFKLVFDVNRSEPLFYGSDWVSSKSFTLTDSTPSIPLPAYVYTSSRCMIGWSLDSAGGNLYMQFTSDLADALLNTQPIDDSYKMYAIWGKGSDCDEAYDRISLVSENGKVFLSEISRSDSAGASEHGVAKDGTMLLPKTMNGNMLRVVSRPDSSFVLDSLVMTRDGFDGERQVFSEGDPLVYNLNGAKFEAFFGKYNRTPAKFVKPLLDKSGNAIRFTFTTTSFEVTRNVSVHVRLETEEGDPIFDESIADSIVPPYNGEWSKFPLAAGKYVLKATIGDERGPDTTFSEAFEVKAEITAISKNSWQMVSIGNLDKKAMVWDDDAKFYWWDESCAFGDFWQYRELDRKEKIDPSRGYWYSSLEGRPLVLKSKVDTKVADKVVWQLDSIKSGWNLMANPYGFALDLYGDHPGENVGATEESSISFWRWNSDIADYEETSVIDGYEAVWVKVSAATDWTIPVKPEFNIDEKRGGKIDDAESRSHNLAKAVGTNEWRIQAILSDANGHRDSWNVLGASSRPFVTDEPPEGMGDHVSLSIVDGWRKLAKSVKAPSEEQEWTLALNANSDRVGNLSFKGVDNLNSLGFKVFVTIDGKTSEIREDELLRVMLRSNATTATVHVAKSMPAVANLHIDGLRFVQAGNSLNVSFVASDDLAGTRSVVDILDMDGKVVARRSATALAGTNALSFATPHGGIYMLRVRAGSQMKTGRILVK